MAAVPSAVLEALNELTGNAHGDAGGPRGTGTEGQQQQQEGELFEDEGGRGLAGGSTALAAAESAFSFSTSSAPNPSLPRGISWGSPSSGWELEYQRPSPQPPSRALPSPPPSNRSPSPSSAAPSTVLSSPAAPAFQDIEPEEIVLEPTRLYVGGLVVGTSKDAVLRAFARISVPVLDIALRTSYEPTSAFVTVPSPSAASLAISSLHCSSLHGSRLKVEDAFQPSDVFTRPRIRLSNLPQTFDAGDLLRLVRPHVAQPMDVQCTASCGVGGSCEGSFRVKDVQVAERVVKALSGLTLDRRDVGVECEALAKQQQKARQLSPPDRPRAMRERDAGWGARGKGRSRSPPTRRPSHSAFSPSSALTPSSAVPHILSHPLPPRPPQPPQFTYSTAERPPPAVPAPMPTRYPYYPPELPHPQPDYSSPPAPYAHQPYPPPPSYPPPPPAPYPYYAYPPPPPLPYPYQYPSYGAALPAYPYPPPPPPRGGGRPGWEGQAAPPSSPRLQ
ncbi:hypothetical protein JCM10213_006016 [Rhodosporidiobolus nylandii]